MNKTKKYTIIFIIVCFVFIGGMGIWNTHFPSQPKEEITHQETTVSNEINSQKEETQQDKTQTSNDTTKQEQTQKKTQSQTQKETTQKTQDNSKTETTKTPENKTQSSQDNESQPEQKKYVEITITGIDSTIVQDKVSIEDNQSVYDVLKTITNKKGIELKANGFGPTIYIVGIHGLNEFDNGPRSGWKYKVNGKYPSQSAGSYKVKDGDHIEWIYTTNG